MSVSGSLASPDVLLLHSSWRQAITTSTGKWQASTTQTSKKQLLLDDCCNLDNLSYLPVHTGV